MEIKILNSFSVKLNNQVDYIARDKPAAAKNSKRVLLIPLRQ